MAKFIVSLIIIVIAAGVVFYFGWIQFQLPPNSYGVIFTKSHGWEQEVVRPGTFVWRWQRLIPTNLTLYVFSAEPHTVTVESSGTLPSADLYSQYLEGNPDFSYSLSLDVTYAVKPEALPELARDQGLKPGALEELYEASENRIRNQAVQAVAAAIQEVGREGARVGLPSMEPELIDTLRQEHENLDIISVSVRELRIPDLDLYRAARETYFATLETRRQALEEATAQETQATAVQQTRLELLERYGEILERYPVLLDYFTLSADQGIDPLQLR